VVGSQSSALFLSMAGLDPAIQCFRHADLDARLKAGHGELEVLRPE